MLYAYKIAIFEIRTYFICVTACCFVCSIYQLKGNLGYHNGRTNTSSVQTKNAKHNLQCVLFSVSSFISRSHSGSHSGQK